MGPSRRASRTASRGGSPNARALVTDAPLVLCDEPTGNLDEETGKMVLSYMKKLGDQRRKTLLVVTHNAVIGRMADRVPPRPEDPARHPPLTLAAPRS